MKLFWAGCIFAAGYVLGRPEGRAKLAELLQRPEVAQLRQQATSTASTAAKTGQQQLAKATQKVKDTAAEKRRGKPADGSGVVTDAAGLRRGFRLPPFPRRGGRPDAAAAPAAGPAETATGTATHDTPTSPEPGNENPAASSAVPPPRP